MIVKYRGWERLPVKLKVSHLTRSQYEVSPSISKIACWAHEIPRLENETYVYQILQEQKTQDESPIAPEFLAHLTENARVMGFLMEKVQGDFVSINDLLPCERILGRFHGLGMLHGDVNRYNFLTDHVSSQIRLVDFEHAEIFDTEKAAHEMASLVSELTEYTKRGAPGIMEYR